MSDHNDFEYSSGSRPDEERASSPVTPAGQQEQSSDAGSSQYSGTQYSGTQYGAPQYGSSQYGSSQHGGTQYSNSQYSGAYTPPENHVNPNSGYYGAQGWQQTPSAAPAPSRQDGKPGGKKRRKKAAARIIAAVLALAIVGGAAGVFFSNYTFVSGSDGTLFSVVKRGFSQDMQTPPDQSSNGGSSAQDPAPVNPNGPTLEINGAPSSSGLVSGSISTSGELSVADIAAKCTPSVVGITASTESQYYGLVSSVGTGIIMSDDGYIITNCHVISGASHIVVTLMDESTHDATLVGSDERSDLAVLKINANGVTLVPAEFGNSDELRVGDLAVAIGNPLGLDYMGTVTDGIISAINRNVVVDERTMTLIQTNAAINSGNSGGPLINKYGQVIGINTLKMQDYSTTVEGLGFAIPTNTAKEIIDELITYGYVKGRPALGISGRNVDSYTRQRFNVPYGVIVYSINTLSNAYEAGLRPGDIITHFNGELVYSVDEINSAKEAFTAGDTITLTYYRDGAYYDISFALNDEAVLDQAGENYVNK